MSYSVVVSERAKNQLNESYDWYESKRESLGTEFRAEVRITIDRLSEGQVHCQIYSDNIRKVSLHRFPYYIYYERMELTREIVILAVLHYKMNPDEIARLFK